MSNSKSTVKFFEFIRPDSTYDFVGKRKIFGGVSLAAMVLTFVLLFTKGLNYGIDFTGGAELQVKVPTSWEIGKLRSTLEGGGIEGAKVQQIGEATEGQFLVRVQGEEKELNAIAEKVGGVLNAAVTAASEKAEILRTSVVGPAAGESLRTSGFLSMLYALVCILIYVTLRFDGRYSPGAVIALFHDTVITMGVFILTQKPFDLQILAALLALIGYSNNDTIIVYDRVRETLHLHPKMSIEEAVNKAINETLGRTILTSLTTFLSVLALWAFGGKVIEDFAFTLMVGIIVGTYSSVFIASNLVIFMTHYYRKREVKLAMQGGKKPTSAARARA